MSSALDPPKQALARGSHTIRVTGQAVLGPVFLVCDTVVEAGEGSDNHDCQLHLASPRGRWHPSSCCPARGDLSRQLCPSPHSADSRFL